MLGLQVSDNEEHRLASVEMFSQVVDISPYLVRDFIMKEAQTQEEVSTFSVHFVAGNVVPRFPSVKAGCFVGKCGLFSC